MLKINKMVLRLYLQGQDLTQRAQRFGRDEDGQGMSEYALLVVLVAIFLIGGVVLLRGELAAILTTITTGLRTR